MADQQQTKAPSTPYARMGAGVLPMRGMPRGAWRDFYHVLLTLPLWAFFAVMAAAFLTVNAVFAGLYVLDPGGLSGAQPGNFADAFFFSVQTMGTMGYGVMAPRSLYVNWVVTAEVFVGLFNLAIATGLLFARISRPTARIMFTRSAVIAPFDGTPTLMFRAANRRRNLVLEAEVSVTLLLEAKTLEGATLRRFHEIKTHRARTPLFFLTWQVMHTIDEASPLFGETRESLLAKRAEIVVVIKGIVETFVSTIHARTSYTPDEIQWNRRLADVFVEDENGVRILDFHRFHDLV